MEEVLPLVLTITAARVAGVLVGLAVIYMGYRLFMAGIAGEAGNVSGSYGSGRLSVQRAAPGTLFVLCGVGIAATSLLAHRGISGKQRVPVGPGTTPYFQRTDSIEISADRDRVDSFEVHAAPAPGPVADPQ